MGANSKKILSAVIGSLIAGAATSAVANEAGKPVFYGNFNVSVDLVDGEGAKTAGPAISGTADHVKLTSNNSRIGFTHELGLDHGLKALVKAEVKVNTDSSTTPFESRELYLGVKGDFGQVIAGRINRPLRTVEGRIDQFNHLYGDINTVLGGETFSDNVVQYSTPKFGNVSAKIAYIAAENKQQDKTATTDDGYSASITFDNSKFYAAFGYEFSAPNVGAANIDLNNPSVSTVVKTPILDAAGGETGDYFETKTSSTVTRNVDRARLGLQYNFGKATLGAIVQHQVDSNDSKVKDFAYVVNGAYTINKVKLKAQHGSVEGESKKTRDFFAVGADYALGKGSYVYTTYTQINLDDLATEKTDNIFQVGFNQAF